MGWGNHIEDGNGGDFGMAFGVGDGDGALVVGGHVGVVGGVVEEAGVPRFGLVAGLGCGEDGGEGGFGENVEEVGTEFGFVGVANVVDDDVTNAIIYFVNLFDIELHLLDPVFRVMAAAGCADVLGEVTVEERGFVFFGSKFK